MVQFPTLHEQAERKQDDRGYLDILYESPGVTLKRSFSHAGVFRGLHVQSARAPQVKLVRVVSGRIIDFVVSINDPAREIHHRRLAPEDDWVRIDAEYAHGFYALEDTLFEYICDGRYDEGEELSFSIAAYLKDVLGIERPILSPKDRAAAPLVGV